MNTQTVEIKGRGQSWKIYYPNEERLASPFPVYDKEGNYKTTLWCGSDTAGSTEAHFTGTRLEAEAYARYLVPGCEISVSTTLTKQESLERARKAKHHD